jgi:threonyl-tRNA synthetase
VVGIPVSGDQTEYVEQLAKTLRSRGVRVEVDASDDRMQKKIRNHTLQKVPFLLLAGGRDAEADAISFRFRDGTQRNGVPLVEAVEAIVEWIARRENSSPTEHNFDAGAT